mmetsp:Transcript_40209/g.127292  ORF Transcript_40209/g.127292 Transcript_40209/m.127292 type:complete len:547 (+) Transcript_40209:1499-3139(+)
MWSGHNRHDSATSVSIHPRRHALGALLARSGHKRQRLATVHPNGCQSVQVRGLVAQWFGRGAGFCAQPSNCVFQCAGIQRSRYRDQCSSSDRVCSVLLVPGHCVGRVCDRGAVFAWCFRQVQQQQWNGKEHLLLSDPQVVSRQKEFGLGDLGEQGLRAFFRSHRCGPTCRALGVEVCRPPGIDPTNDMKSEGPLQRAVASSTAKTPVDTQAQNILHTAHGRSVLGVLKVLEANSGWLTLDALNTLLTPETRCALKDAGYQTGAVRLFFLKKHAQVFTVEVNCRTGISVGLASDYFHHFESEFGPVHCRPDSNSAGNILAQQQKAQVYQTKRQPQRASTSTNQSGHSQNLDCSAAEDASLQREQEAAVYGDASSKEGDCFECVDAEEEDPWLLHWNQLQKTSHEHDETEQDPWLIHWKRMQEANTLSPGSSQPQCGADAAKLAPCRLAVSSQGRSISLDGEPDDEQIKVAVEVQLGIPKDQQHLVRLEGVLEVRIDRKMYVSDLSFTQDTIRPLFGNGSQVYELLNDLVSGKVDPLKNLEPLDGCGR